MSLRLIFAAVFAMALLSLNFPQFFYEPYALWFRVLDQALLIVGTVGAFWISRRIRYVAWLGIALYIPYSIFGSIPTLDHPGFNANGDQPAEIWMTKFGLSLIVSVALLVCFRKLTSASQTRVRGIEFDS